MGSFWYLLRGTRVSEPLISITALLGLSCLNDAAIIRREPWLLFTRAGSGRDIWAWASSDNTIGALVFFKLLKMILFELSNLIKLSSLKGQLSLLVGQGLCLCSHFIRLITGNVQPLNFFYIWAFAGLFLDLFSFCLFIDRVQFTMANDDRKLEIRRWRIMHRSITRS